MLQGIPKTARELKAEKGKIWSKLFFATLFLSLIFNAIDTGKIFGRTKASILRYRHLKKRHCHLVQKISRRKNPLKIGFAYIILRIRILDLHWTPFGSRPDPQGLPFSIPVSVLVTVPINVVEQNVVS